MPEPSPFPVNWATSSRCSIVGRRSETARHEADESWGDPAVAIMGRGFAMPFDGHWSSLTCSCGSPAALLVQPHSLHRSNLNGRARGYAERVTL